MGGEIRKRNTRKRNTRKRNFRRFNKSKRITKRITKKRYLRKNKSKNIRGKIKSKKKGGADCDYDSESSRPEIVNDYIEEVIDEEAPVLPSISLQPQPEDKCEPQPQPEYEMSCPELSGNIELSGSPDKMNLVYMAKPGYGGWVTFTAHMTLKYGCDLFKIKDSETALTEVYKSGLPRLRDYGYGAKYQNINIKELVSKTNLLITAIDKNYYKFLDQIPSGTVIVIHDPTEVKGKSCQKVIDNLHRFRVVTIRESVKQYLLDTFGIESDFLLHPFYEYKKKPVSVKNKAVSVSRIDFDKHTEIILAANVQLKCNPIEVYGKANNMYTGKSSPATSALHNINFKGKNLLVQFKENYRGAFDKTFEAIDSILSDAKYMVDMSAIFKDGGGSQYTFLEAIYEDCVLVLSNKWVSVKGSDYKHDVNCIVIGERCDMATHEKENESKQSGKLDRAQIRELKNKIKAEELECYADDLSHVITNESHDLDNLLTNARLLLLPHISVDWTQLFR